MSRFMQIKSVRFGQTTLPLPLSVHLSRCVEAKSACGDNDAFPTSVEICQPSIIAEVRIRGTAVAEGLSLGQRADLAFTVEPGRSGALSRTITVAGAVLVAVELSYQQANAATAILRLVAEASDGSQEPFLAEDAE